MDVLTDRLELAARSAADRLRRAVAAGEAAERAEEERHGDAGAQETSPAEGGDRHVPAERPDDGSPAEGQDRGR
jgi:hypothetical protein